MKILLVALNAKYIHSNLAVHSLKAYAKEYQEHIEIAEYTINHQKDRILKDIFLRKPDVVAFSCYIWNLDYVEDLIGDLGKIMPKVAVFAGGPEVSYDGDAFMKRNPFVKGVMVGEGEAIFASLCKELCENGLTPQICGVLENPGCMDMSEIPFVYKDLEEFENRIVYYESSRGCPFSCSYCLSAIDKKVRFRDMKLVKEELGFFLEKKVPQVKFVDRTFNCNKKRALEIWQYILEHDNGVTNFHFEISADLLSEEELDLLKKFRPGAVQLEIGVQSTNPLTIEEIHRTMNLDKLKKIVETVKSFQNIHQHLDLIAGLPFEDLETFKKSFNEVYDMEPDQMQLGFLKVLKGSYMHSMVKEYELSYKERPNYEVLSTKWLTFGDILQLKAVEEMVEMYYNSGQFQATIKHLVKEFESPYVFYEKLAAYFEAEGFEQNAPARMTRYIILLGFIKKNFPEEMYPGKVDFYKETLTFDLYAREKLKNRPEWMRMQTSEEKEKLKQVGKQNHVETFSYGKEVFLEGLSPVRMKPKLLFFDYSRRNPLNHSAYVEEIHEKIDLDEE